MCDWLTVLKSTGGNPLSGEDRGWSRRTLAQHGAHIDDWEKWRCDVPERCTAVAEWSPELGSLPAALAGQEQAALPVLPPVPSSTLGIRLLASPGKPR